MAEDKTEESSKSYSGLRGLVDCVAAGLFGLGLSSVGLPIALAASLGWVFLLLLVTLGYAARTLSTLSEVVIGLVRIFAKPEPRKVGVRK